FSPLQLVPAPKNCKWEFKEPESKEEEDKKKFGAPLLRNEECVIWSPSNPADLDLRPLAHVGIREQTVMTLLMMCLANTVETKQGDPSTDFEKVHEKGVFSYGNRLYCHYDDDGLARHQYGSSTSYSKYSVDYQKFLDRPYYFAKKGKDDTDDGQEVFILELDLSKFFDRVSRPLLAEKIKTLSGEEEGKSSQYCNALLDQFIKWEWSELAKAHYEQVCSSDKIPTAPDGLPQGLVSAGFLANIYMLEFDNELGSAVGSNINPDENSFHVKILDYCRYVDDMRLVVSAPISNNDERITEQDIKDAVKKYIDGLISTAPKDGQSLDLEINPDKTKINAFCTKSHGISNELSSIQGQLSGPVAFDDAQNHLGTLNSLLSLESKGAGHNDGDQCQVNRLEKVGTDHIDLREDTLKRFAANNITKLLRNVRNFSAHDVDKNGKPKAGDWDYQQELFARRFVSAWSYNPSLTLLLKKGLELFPCSRLLKPVLEQLEPRLSSSECPKIKAVARYCLAEIFRHAATVIHGKDQKLIPVHANTDIFFELLQQEAANILKGVKVCKSSDGFDLLAEQAQFLLLVRLDSTLEIPSSKPKHDLILKLISGFRQIAIEESLSKSELASCILLAEQLAGSTKPLIRSVASLIKSSEDSALEILAKVAEQRLEFFKSLVWHARAVGHDWVKDDETKVLIKLWGIDQRPILKPLEKITGSQSLLRLIQRSDNPFTNEIMALKLFDALLKHSQWEQEQNPESWIDLTNTKIEFAEYSNPPKLIVFDAQLEIEKLEFADSSHTQLSSHLTNSKGDTFKLQRIAMCMRSVLLGLQDWTTHNRSISEQTGYRGIKSSQYQRMLGLFTTPHSLGGESAKISDWLTTLLSRMLSWPGSSMHSQGYKWPDQLTADNVQKLVSDRLETMQKLYCMQSEMPALPERIHLDWEESKKNLTVAMVQSKLPRNADFEKYDLFLNDPVYRSRHRRHIADVAKLVCSHIDAQRTGDKPLDKKTETSVDLIVWPELAVHQDDLDILIALSRKTHAIIYAGLTFINQPDIKGPNNCAIWIIPRKSNTSQKELIRLQGKYHMTSWEKETGVEPWRPYQLMLELKHKRFPDHKGFMLTGSICYDSTDIALSADLRDKSNAYIVSAHNQDINTFDAMIDALHYHMYQPVVLVNSGEFGGSCAKAPYKEHYHRLIAHSHGNNQVSINTFEMNMFDFRRDKLGESLCSAKARKTQPAGVMG
ncbi:RNA-directed DNA polymerase, partial [Sansalvadorimonas sp. 2012CJ34-2]